MKPDRIIWLTSEPSDEQWELLHRAADEVYTKLGELVVFRVERPVEPADFTRDIILRAEYAPREDPTLPDEWPREVPVLPSVCVARNSLFAKSVPRGCIRNRGPPGFGGFSAGFVRNMKSRMGV